MTPAPVPDPISASRRQVASDELLAPALVARLAGRRLATPARITGTRDGTHRSTRRGTSIEFADRRPYLHGDDPRRVDLAASRRSGRLLVRLDEAVDDLALQVVVDVSMSMVVGGKLEAARTLSLALAHIAGAGGDRVQVMAAGPHDIAATPLTRGLTAMLATAHLWRTVDRHPDERTHPGPARLRAAIHRVRAAGRAGVVVLVSDLLVEDWRDVVATLAAGGHPAVVIHLLGREDVELDAQGDLELVDAETGDVVEVALTPDVLDAHAAAVAQFRADVVAHAARHGVPVIAPWPGTDPATTVLTDMRAIGLVT